MESWTDALGQELDFRCESKNLAEVTSERCVLVYMPHTRTLHHRHIITNRAGISLLIVARFSALLQMHAVMEGSRLGCVTPYPIPGLSAFPTLLVMSCLHGFKVG